MGFNSLESMLNNVMGLSSAKSIKDRILEIENSMAVMKDWESSYREFSIMANESALSIENFINNSKFDKIMFAPITNSESLSLSLNVIVKARNMLKACAGFEDSFHKQLEELGNELEKLNTDMLVQSDENVEN